MSCPSNSYFVKAHSRNAYFRSNGTFVSSTNVKAYCKEKTDGYIFWNEKLKNGLPKVWPHKKEKSSKWTEEQKERVLEALELLPEAIWKESVEGIFRGKQSKDFPNPASNGGGYIVLYDNAFQDKRGLERVLAHEFAHGIYQQLKRKDSLDYRLSAGAETFLADDSRTILMQPRKSGYVEADGDTSFEEDFANNVEYFLFDSDKLKKLTPKAYSWIEKYFGNNFKVKAKKGR